MTNAIMHLKKYRMYKQDLILYHTILTFDDHEKEAF